MQGINTYIPDTNCVPREYSVAAILLLLFMVLISLLLLLLLLLLLRFVIYYVTYLCLTKKDRTVSPEISLACSPYGR